MFQNKSRIISADSGRIRPNFEIFVMTKKVFFGWSTSVVKFTIVNTVYF